MPREEALKESQRSLQKEGSKTELRRPGIEPGSTVWKAAMLTIIPPTPRSRGAVFPLIQSFSCRGDIQATSSIPCKVSKLEIRWERSALLVG